MIATKTRYPEPVLQIASFAKVMSHPVRAYILKCLSAMNTCCYSGDIAEELGIGRSALSQHLKELKYAGLIQGEIEGPYIKYCINRENWNRAKATCMEFFSDSA